MSEKLYCVQLSPSERERLENMLRGGQAKARELTRARILLKSDQGWSDERIHKALDVSVRTCERVRQRYAQREGVQDALTRQEQQNHRPPKLDGEGVANLFMLFEPLVGRVEVKVTRRRTRQDWTRLIRELVDEHYPQAERIVLVLDNLNTHEKASLYATFPPEEARRLCEKIEIHYTPKHGSWLNMAEIELSVLARQCLARRLGTMERLEQEVQAWVEEQRRTPVKVKWQFTSADARIRLKHLYPTLQSC